MSNSNIQTVREFIEVVLNQKRFEQAFTYMDRDCVSHSPPYIGIGFNWDSTSGTEIKVIKTSPNGPSDGRLLPGDEIVRVTDGKKTWSTFEELSQSVWPLGMAGTSITVTVRRDGQLLDVPITRGRVEAFDIKIADQIDVWKESTLKYWPDLVSEIRMIFGSDDLVACHLINSGTSQEFHRFAVWSEYDIFRLRDGRIVEMWGLEDSLQQLMQLGYELKAPLQETA